MRLKKSIILITLLLCTGLVGARESYQQERANLSVRVVSFAQAADDLREITGQFPVTVANLNLNTQSESGNANLRVPPEQMAAVLRELSNMGQLENQSQSVNDLTSSYQQYERRLKVFQQLQKAETNQLFAKLPSEMRGEAETEFQNWVKGQVTSAESTLLSYREQASYALHQLHPGSFNRSGRSRAARSIGPALRAASRPADRPFSGVFYSLPHQHSGVVDDL